MIKHRGPPSQTCAAIDLCLVPTLTFECLFAFLVVSHGRRQLLWFAVTKHPTAEWLAQQIAEAFPWDTAPRYLIRDNDSCVYRKLKPGRSGDEVRQGLGVNRCFRSAEQGERPEHLCPMTGVF
jgi:hypothetical protein